MCVTVLLSLTLLFLNIPICVPYISSIERFQRSVFAYLLISFILSLLFSSPAPLVLQIVIYFYELDLLFLVPLLDVALLLGGFCLTDTVFAWSVVFLFLNQFSFRHVHLIIDQCQKYSWLLIFGLLVL